SRQSWQVFDNEGRVSLPSRPKVRFDAEMHFERPTFEPATASVSQMGRLLSLRDAKRRFIEGARFRLAAGRHRQLDMIQRHYPHCILTYRSSSSFVATAAGGCSNPRCSSWLTKRRSTSRR